MGLESFLPGQYVPVKVQEKMAAETLIRNYTISDSPKRNYYRLTIKRENEGKMSRYFHDSIGEGDEVELGKPMGNFHLSIGSKKPVVLLSGGVGITPMLSMLEYVAQNEPDRILYFIHSSLDSTVQPMSKRLMELEKKLSNTYMSIHHTQPNKDEIPGIDFTHKGLIKKTFLESTLYGVQAEYYLCGPVGFMETMYRYLVEMDIDSANINYEFFGEGKSLGDKPMFHDSNVGGHSIYFKKSGIRTLWNEKASSILEAAEANGLAPKFSCRTGSCATCETTIRSGSVTYDPEPFVAIPENKILTCCSRPISDLVIDL